MEVVYDEPKAEPLDQSFQNNSAFFFFFKLCIPQPSHSLKICFLIAFSNTTLL